MNKGILVKPYQRKDRRVLRAYFLLKYNIFADEITRAIFLFLIFFFFPFLVTAQISDYSYSDTAFSDSIDISTIFSIENDSLYVESIVPHDLNTDGYEDLLITVNNRFQLASKLYFIPGSENGFKLDETTILLDGYHLTGLQVGDWNGDLEKDLITQTVPSYYTKQTEVFILDGSEITDNYVLDPGLSFVGELVAVSDLDLDGQVDLVYATYDNVVIGWNEGAELDTDTITSNARNTYKLNLLDVNQDGFEDFIVDEQTENAPVVFINQKDRTFNLKNVGLPENDPEQEYGHYYQYKPILFNEDIYPDLIVDRESFWYMDSTYVNTRPATTIHIYDPVSETYELSNFRIDTLTPLSFFHAVQINNDGFLDFLQKNNDQLTIVENIDNSLFSLHTYELTSDVSLMDLTNVDADQDGDQDILFSEFRESAVYLIKNNSSPEDISLVAPQINTLTSDGNTITVSWESSAKSKNNPVHLEYGLKVSSENLNLIIGNINPNVGNRQTSKVLAGFQNNQLTIPNLPNGEYTISVSAYDQMGKFSGFSDPKSIMINSTSNEGVTEIPANFELFQNYPNPFNPTTTIKYQLPQISDVSLEVFDVNGRLVAELVDEIQGAGIHKINFDAKQLSSGLYIYRLRAKDRILVRKLLLLK